MSVGWTYQPARFCPSVFGRCEGCETLKCLVCKEGMVTSDEEPGIPLCPRCDDLVPAEWERLHREGEGWKWL